MTKRFLLGAAVTDAGLLAAPDSTCTFDLRAQARDDPARQPMLHGESEGQVENGAHGIRR